MKRKALGLNGTLMMDAHILLMATPIWVSQPSSLSKRALERTPYPRKAER